MRDFRTHSRKTRKQQAKALEQPRLRPPDWESFSLAVAYARVAKACRPYRHLWRQETPIVIGIVAGEDTEYVAHALRKTLGDGLGMQTCVNIVDKEAPPGKPDSDSRNAVRDFDRVVLVLKSADLFPTDFHLAFDAVVMLERATVEQVKGAARQTLRAEISDDEARYLATVPHTLLDTAFRKGRPISVALAALKDAVSNGGPTPENHDGPTLNDLHGIGEAAEWGRELAIDLADWRAGRISWSAVDRGILLSGPSGTGKTTFAGALARTCGVHLVATSVARWQSAGHMGDMLQAMQASFAEARRNAPSILFLDEIDSIGNRETFRGDNAQYCREVVNGLLECVDGLSGREGVVVVGATNDPGFIDPSFLRPGRLDRHIEISLPDEGGREGILRWHLKGDLADEILHDVVTRTEDMSGARLEQIVRGARRIARRDRRPLKVSDLLEQLPPRHPIPAEILWRTAIHEAGHAVIGSLLGHWRVVEAKLTTHYVDGQTTEAGWVEYTPPPLMRGRDYYIAHAVRSLAGMVAEEILLGNRADGAGGIPGSDLYKATLDIYYVEASLGFGKSVMYLGDNGDEDFVTTLHRLPELRRRVDAGLKECLSESRRLVTTHRDDVMMFARALYLRKHLDEGDIERVLASHRHESEVVITNVPVAVA